MLDRRAGSNLFSLPNIVGTLTPAIAAAFEHAAFAFASVKKPAPTHKQLTFTIVVQLTLLAFYRSSMREFVSSLA